VTEWGVHWNFFATISLVNFCLLFIRDVKHCMLVASLVMICYEISLISFGLKDFILYGPRLDLISANREGIFSSFGYLSTALVGMAVGRHIFHHLV